MRLRLRHSTRYLYRSPVWDGFNEVRLRPATEDPKRLLFYLLRVTPPVRLRHFRDEHRNYVQWFEIPEQHSELIIEAQAHVQTTSQYALGRPDGLAFAPLSGSDQHDLLRPFLASSQYVTINPEVWRLAVDIRDGRTQVFETAEAIMGHIHEHWTYAPNTTTASTHMLEVLHDRRGVCQDLAHLMIGLCRALEIPARYVSGYLYNGPLHHLRGAQASHAWCEIWLPALGWFGLDPTNNILVDERYVKIATGRDYHDAAPIRGQFSGPPAATSAMEVTVAVEKMNG